ncbi:hypothetical protein [Brevibacillus brevis]|uniref:hypothetical protein n=1 Tax=Brevibacillus brevis TaxID=1393 RepID=UPI0007D8C5A9|nr:hypothetical protein [Brevibacillus brevis]
MEKHIYTASIINPVTYIYELTLKENEHDKLNDIISSLKDVDHLIFDKFMGFEIYKDGNLYLDPLKSNETFLIWSGEHKDKLVNILEKQGEQYLVKFPKSTETFLIPKESFQTEMKYV